jgi:hypothetical protein
VVLQVLLYPAFRRPMPSLRLASVVSG